jgi:hypothetical protein
MDGEGKGLPWSCQMGLVLIKKYMFEYKIIIHIMKIIFKHKKFMFQF